MNKKIKVGELCVKLGSDVTDFRRKPGILKKTKKRENFLFFLKITCKKCRNVVG